MKPNTLYAAVLFSFSWLVPIQALAASVTLVCVNRDAPNYPWTFLLDEGAKTANGISARFTDQEITWHDTNSNADYTLNRLSGILQIRGTQNVTAYTCHAGQKQF
jgi:hypothetical protein